MKIVGGCDADLKISSVRRHFVLCLSVLCLCLWPFSGRGAQGEALLGDFYKPGDSAIPSVQTGVAQGNVLQRELIYLLGVHYYHLAHQQNLGATVSCEVETQGLVDKAAGYLRHAALLGHPQAKYAMGYLHLVGFVSQNANPESALGWLQDAIKYHSQPAMLALGSVLAVGYQIKKDIYLALDILMVAQREGNPVASIYIDWIESFLYHERRQMAHWIQTQNPTNFTIEYAIGLNEQSAREFLIANQAMEVSAMYRAKDDFWKVIFGSFASRFLAEARLKALFGDMIISQFSIRRMALVQEEILPSNPTQGLGWVQQQKPGSHTLLLGSFIREADAQDFIVLTGLRNAGLIKTGPLSYLVLAGEFETFAAAQQAIGGLPDNVRTYSPSPVSFAEVANAVLSTPVNRSVPYVDASLRDGNWVQQQIRSVFGQDLQGAELEMQLLNAIHVDVLAANDDQNAMQWLNSLADTQYTVELFRGTSRHEVLDMAGFIGLDGGQVIQDRSGIWHLLTGVFASEELAAQAISQLPEAVLALQPATATISSVKQSLNASPLGPVRVMPASQTVALQCMEGSSSTEKSTGNGSELEAGEAVTVLSRRFGWSQVQRQDGGVGWVRSALLAPENEPGEE